MIKCDKTLSGGSVCVENGNETASVSFIYSNKTNPLSLSCVVDRKSSCSLSYSIIENLIQKYNPCVVVLTTHDTTLRFKPKIGSVFRCWTSENQSLFTEGFSSRKLFNRVCDISSAMQDYNFIKAENEELQFFRYKDVISKVKENTNPMEFSSIKEECDYSIRSSCVRSVRSIMETANSSLALLSHPLAKQFNEAIENLNTRQNEYAMGFDIKNSIIQEATNFILIPAIVKLGNDHPFTQAIFDEFSKSTSHYISSSEKFLKSHKRILR